ncbi:MAG: hypothetical protein ACI4NF_06335 [Christensenellales bacterium]
MKRILITFVSLMLAVLFSPCGCARNVKDADTVDEPSAESGISPSPTSAPDSVYAMNPIFELYTVFYSDASAALTHAENAFEAQRGIDAVNSSVLVSLHLYEISLAWMSAGLLPSNENGGFSGNVSGIGEGSGAIKNSAASQSFDYSYADGRLMNGTVYSSKLTFSIKYGSYDIRAFMLKLDNKWMTCAQVGERWSVLEISGSDVSFACGRCPSSPSASPYPQDHAASPSPSVQIDPFEVYCKTLDFAAVTALCDTEFYVVNGILDIKQK